MINISEDIRQAQNRINSLTAPHPPRRNTNRNRSHLFREWSTADQEAGLIDTTRAVTFCGNRFDLAQPHKQARVVADPNLLYADGEVCQRCLTFARHNDVALPPSPQVPAQASA